MMKINKKNTARLATVTEVKTTKHEDCQALIIDNGWQVVVEKDAYQVGDQVTFIPAGSWIPSTLVGLSESGEYKGVKGGYLPVMKLAGEDSEGIVLSADKYDENQWARVWERDLPQEFQPESYRSYPTFIRKVEYPHAQDIPDLIFNEYHNQQFEITPRIDGIEMTVFVKGGRFGICSDRYWIDESTKDAFWKFAYDLNLPTPMVDYRDQYAIHGTIAGKGIYQNHEKMNDRRFFVHDIYDIESSTFMTPKERYKIFSDLAESCNFHHVDIFKQSIPLCEVALDMRQFVNYANGNSMTPYSKRKGLVFKSIDSEFGFKIKSNNFCFSHKL